MSGRLGDDLGDLLGEDYESVERGRQPAGMQPQQKVAIGIAALLIAGAVGYFVLGSDDSGRIQSQGVSAFASGDGSNRGQMVIGNFAEKEEQDTKVLVQSSVEPKPLPDTESATVKRLQDRLAKLEADLSVMEEKKRLVDDALRENRELLKQADKRQKDAIRDLEKIKGEEIKAVRASYDAQIKQLENDLALARSLGASLFEEERKRLEEQRKRRREAIESKGIIFDSTTEEQPGIKY